MKGCRDLCAACAVAALDTALSHDGMELQLSRMFPVYHVVWFFFFWKTVEKNSKRRTYLFSGSCLAPVVRGLMGEVATGLVPTVPVGFAELLSHELQSWTKIHVVSE